MANIGKHPEELNNTKKMYECNVINFLHHFEIPYLSFFKLKLSWQISLIYLIFLPNLPNSVKIKNQLDLNVSKFKNLIFVPFEMS